MTGCGPCSTSAWLRGLRPGRTGRSGAGGTLRSDDERQWQQLERKRRLITSAIRSRRWPRPARPAGRAGLVAEVQPLVLAGQLGRQAAHAFRRRVHLAVEPDLAVAPGGGDRHRVAQLRDIDPDESLLGLGHGSPSSGEEGLVPPGGRPERGVVGPCRSSLGRTYGLTFSLAEVPPRSWPDGRAAGARL